MQIQVDPTKRESPKEKREHSPKSLKNTMKSPISGIQVTNANMHFNIINIILYRGGERMKQKEREWRRRGRRCGSRVA